MFNEDSKNVIDHFFMVEREKNLDTKHQVTNHQK